MKLVKTFGRGAKAAAELIETLEKRGAASTARVEPVVRRILADVRKGRDRALLKYAAQFDALAKGQALLVSRDEMRDAYAKAYSMQNDKKHEVETQELLFSITSMNGRCQDLRDHGCDLGRIGRHGLRPGRELVALAGHGHDHSWRLGIRLDLAAQTRYQHIDTAVVGLRATAGHDMGEFIA